MARPTIAIIGAGFAGTTPLGSWPTDARSEVVLVNPTDYFLYLPLLPEVAAGILDPRRVTVSIPGRCGRYACCWGRWSRSDFEEKQLTHVDPEGDRGSCPSTACC